MKKQAPRYFQLDSDRRTYVLATPTRYDSDNFSGIYGTKCEKPEGFDEWPLMRFFAYTAVEITVRRKPESV
jgi:hypothetical protein